MARTERPRPNALSASWPESPSSDPAGEVARRFALALAEQIGSRTLREVAEQCELTHATLVGILAGRTWPDMRTISRLEDGLDVDLWPGRILRSSDR